MRVSKRRACPQVEALLASEDYGKDLASVNNLLKKHQLLEADISAHEVWPSQQEAAGKHFLPLIRGVPPAGPAEGPEQPGGQPDVQRRLRHVPGEGQAQRRQRPLRQDQEHGCRAPRQAQRVPPAAPVLQGPGRRGVLDQVRASGTEEPGGPQGSPDGNAPAPMSVLLSSGKRSCS